MSEGDRVWRAIIAAAGVSPWFKASWFDVCTVRHYDGHRLTIGAPDAVHRDALLAYCTKALGEGRDAVAPGVRLVVTVGAQEGTT